MAWHSLGWRPAWFAEIEQFPSAVLAYRWPHVENLGDMTTIAASIRVGDVEAPDLLVGGTPCQAFSVAGMRAGLEDARGQLTLEYVRLADAVDKERAANGKEPTIIVWENVPGVLSSKDNAFGCFLAGLAGEDDPLVPPGKRWGNSGAVYGPKRAIAWRILDAQYFGLAQRRRRVFLVASAREGFDPAAILFEREGVRRDSAPRRGQGESITQAVTQGVDLRNGAITGEVTHTVQAGGHAPDPGGTPHVIVVHGTQDPDVRWNQAHTLGRNSGQENVVLFVTLRGREGGATAEMGDDLAGCLRASSGGGDKPHVLTSSLVGSSVRRLTPTECERLQGFPDGYTQIPWRKKPADQCPDGPRYKALGNSKAVPVVRWLGQRIAKYVATYRNSCDL